MALTIVLGKTTVIFGLVFLVLGYFVGNTLPISGLGGPAESGGNSVTVTGQQPSAQDGTVQQQQQPSEGTAISLSPDDDPTIGDLSAPVQVYEFSDYQCPFCQRFFEDSVKQMEPEYIDTGKVLFIYKDFPLQSIHPAAVPTAIYAWCAQQQGKWREFHDTVFEQQSLLGSGKAGLDQIADQAGLDQDQLSTCLDGQDQILDEIQSDLQFGSSLGVSGTPSMFIGNEEKGYTMIRGAQPYSIVKQTIEQYLQ